jgi:hypothetical protein
LEKQLQVKIIEVGIKEEQLPKPNPTTEEINSRNDKKDKRSKETNEEGEPVTPKQKAIKRATRRAKKLEQAKEDQS